MYLHFIYVNNRVEFRVVENLPEQVNDEDCPRMVVGEQVRKDLNRIPSENLYYKIVKPKNSED